MTTESHLRKGMLAALAEQEERVVNYADTYNRVAAHLVKWGAQKMTEYRHEFDGELLRMVERRAAEANAAMERLMDGKGLKLEVMVNNNAELLLPVHADRKMPLEGDLFNHAYRALQAGPVSPQIGGLGPYIVLQGAPKVMRAAADLLNKTPEGLTLANVSFDVHQIAVPVVALYKTLDVLHVTMTPSSIEWPHIPVSKGNRAFFPPYKRQFELITPHSQTMAWVTSRSDGTKDAGNYICGALKDGALGKAFKQMGLHEGDRLAVTQLMPKQQYSIRKD